VETIVSPISPKPPPRDGPLSSSEGVVRCWFKKSVERSFCNDERALMVFSYVVGTVAVLVARRDVVAIRSRLITITIKFFFMDAHPYFI
jgi:hypothetical protein